MVSVKKYLAYMGIKVVLALMLIFLCILPACIDDPVDKGYFNDLGKIKGGEKPCAPHFADTDLTNDEYAITVNFTDPVETLPAQECVDETGEDLQYVIYASSADPSGFPAEEFYNTYYAVALLDEAGPVDLLSPGSATYYFWITAWDGGRESDHSEIRSITVP